jgi:hypothetical protein
MVDAEDFEEVVGRSLPQFSADLNRAIDLQFRLLHSIAIRKDVHRAPRIILTLATSDLGDLAGDVRRGAGRSAMRAARGLIEAAISMHTVAESVDDADRYVAHLDFGPVLFAQTAPGHDMLRRKDRREYLHRIARDAKAVEGRWYEAVGRYGSGFRRAWHPKSLKDRADKAGLPGFYEGYRIASLVSHGSAAGITFGQLSSDEKDRLTLLAGRVPYLCPTALVLGMDAYLEVLKVIKEVLPEVDTSLAWDSLQEVSRHYPEYVELTNRYMTDLWESRRSAGPSQVTYAAFSRGGRRRWFARTSLQPETLLHAAEPVLADAKRDWLEGLIQAYRDDPDAVFNAGGWAAFALPGVAAQVDWTRPGIPLTAYVMLIENDDSTWTAYSDELGALQWSP